MHPACILRPLILVGLRIMPFAELLCRSGSLILPNGKASVPALTPKQPSARRRSSGRTPRDKHARPGDERATVSTTSSASSSRSGMLKKAARGSMTELGVLRTLSNGSMLSPRTGGDANGHREAHRLVCLPAVPALPAHIESCRLCALDPFVG